MARPGSGAQVRGEELRRRVALEAARLISEDGLRDYRQAKLKAAERLGLSEDAGLPGNRAIDEALREHQRLFQGERHARTLRRLREQACEAMIFFAAHEPRLVGAVLDGTADGHSAICLHLYTDHPQAVAELLRGHRVPFEQGTRRLRLDRDTTAEFPHYAFVAGSVAIDLTVLPFDRLRQAPLDRVTEKPMRRAALGALQALLVEP